MCDLVEGGKRGRDNSMSDMLDTIVPKSDQLNYDDFIGRESRVIKITKVTKKDTKEQPISIFFEGDEGRPYKPSKGMRVAIINCWGDKKENYVGKFLRLYGEPKVKWAGKEQGGIRISEASDISEPVTFLLTIAKGVRVNYTVKPLSALDILKCDGEIAAKKGLEQFTIWGKGLSAEQKASLGDYLKELTLIAKNADKKEGDKN